MPKSMFFSIFCLLTISSALQTFERPIKSSDENKYNVILLDFLFKALSDKNVTNKISSYAEKVDFITDLPDYDIKPNSNGINSITEIDDIIENDYFSYSGTTVNYENENNNSKESHTFVLDLSSEKFSDIEITNERFSADAVDFVTESSDYDIEVDSQVVNTIMDEYVIKEDNFFYNTEASVNYENEISNSNSKESPTVVLDLSSVFIPTLPSVEENSYFNDSFDVPSHRNDIPISNSNLYGNNLDNLLLTIGDSSKLLYQNNEDLYGNKTEKPYGTWKSPVSAEISTQTLNKICEPPRTDPATGHIFWAESLANENSRCIILSFDPINDSIILWTPQEFDVRTYVHEYGGGAFTVYNNTVFFSNGYDNYIYKQVGPKESPFQLTNTSYRRYADGSYSPVLDALFLVVEDHENINLEISTEPQNGLIMVNGTTGKETVLLSHGDFFAYPRINEEGTKLVWVQWNHPEMPWDSTKMFVSKVINRKGKVTITKYFQHGSMMMPKWTVSDELLYVHDTTGWWNLYIVNKRNFEINLTPLSQEVGWPMWQFGKQAFDVNTRIGMNEVVAICGKELMLINTRTQERKIINTPFDSYLEGVAFSLDGDKVYVIAGNGTRFPALIEINIRSGAFRYIKEQAVPISDSFISVPTQIQFPTTQRYFAYGYLYMPKNADFKGTTGTKPPLLVKAHGGPTSSASTVLNMKYQFFTTRGFAIFDIDYRGSTGYGTLYRSQLKEMWGIFDVDDCIAGAKYLVKENLVDPEKLCIDGHSAGGYTAISALTFSSVFKAGASFSGVSDLQLLAKNTHKFEKRYLESLIGIFDTHKDRYVARSPLQHFQKLDTPIIFFQGLDDKIVPPDQAQKMYESVKSKQVPTALILFEGEGHEFKKHSNKMKALTSEIYFYSKIFNFELVNITSDVTIENIHELKSKYT